MTTNHHTAISTGAAANASTFNNPLGQLDAQITTNAAAIAANALLAAATTAELVAARSPYTSLADRIAAIEVFGANVHTNANGAASAGQKNITVDSTVGFLVGAPIAYELVGGVIETNVIASITPTTILTCEENIGTGGIGDNEYIVIITPGAVMSTGAVAGAITQAQQFTSGIVGPIWKPITDGVTALKLANAAGASVVVVDTTDERLGINTEAPAERLDVNGRIAISGVRVLHTVNPPGAEGNNIFVGASSGNLTLSIGGGAAGLASHNSGFGAATLDSLTTGYSNTAAGEGAGHSLTTGYYNSIVGEAAMNLATTGYQNVAVGNDAMGETLSGGHDNTAVGFYSLPRVTGNYNTAIGGGALYALTSGNNNTALGYGAGSVLPTGSGGVFLGYNAGLWENESDHLFIDNRGRINKADGRAKALVYGTFADAVADQRLVVNGYLGIGIEPTGGSAMQLLSLTTTSGMFVQQAGTTGERVGINVWADGSGATKNTAGYFYAASGTSNYGVVIDSISDGANNWALYSSSAAKSYFQGSVGFGITVPVAKVHIDQASTTAAIPALLLDQADVSEPLIKIIGESTTDNSQTLVDAANLTTPGAIVGWYKIYVEDVQGTNPITDGVYWVPFYATPTA